MMMMGVACTLGAWPIRIRKCVGILDFTINVFLIIRQHASKYLNYIPHEQAD